MFDVPLRRRKPCQGDPDLRQKEIVWMNCLDRINVQLVCWKMLQVESNNHIRGAHDCSG